MSLFGNSTFSTIFYIFSIVVTFCITIKLRERLNLYIENIPEKERSFCEKFLSNQVIQIILFAGLGFVLLKFIVDPAMVILFPASITIPTIVGGAYEEEEIEPEIVEIEPVVYEDDENKESNQIGGLNDEEDVKQLINVDALLEQNSAKVQDTEQKQVELINQLQTLQTQLIEQQNKQQELVQQQQVQQQVQQQTNKQNQQQGGEIISEQNQQQTNQQKQQQVQQQKQQQQVQQENIYPEDILPNKAELPVEKPVIETLEGGKKMGRPRKIKSLAKQALGKKNVWAQAVKQAREALGIQGFQPVKKGGLLYKTAQAYYTTLKN